MKVKPRPAARPQLEQIVVAPIYSKFSSYPSHGLTPQRLAAIFREADDGEVGRQMELFEEMEEHDPHLYAQLQTRKNAVTGLDWEVIPFGNDPLDLEITDFISDQLHGIKNFENILLDLLDAVGKGISICEIMWKVEGNIVAVDQIKRVPPKLIRWDQDDIMRLITTDSPMGIIPPQDKMLCHTYRAKSGHPSRAGILRVCAWMYLFKNYDIKDWAAFIEVFGLPLRLGKYMAGASEADKDSLWKALVQMGTDAAGMVPDGTSIEFISTDAAKGSANGIYETMARYCDEQISKAILGQTLTSDGGGGSYAQSKTHNDVRHDLTVADCKALAATIRDDLIRPLVLYNFGPAAVDRLPQLVFDCEQSEDLKALVEIMQTLVNINVPIPLQYIYKKFGIPEPEAGEAVAKVSAPAMLPLSQVINKNQDDPGQRNKQFQGRADFVADTAIQDCESIFKRVFAPISAMVNDSSSLEELKTKLEDEKTVAALLQSCESDNLTQLLADTMLAADLVGRMREHG